METGKTLARAASSVPSQLQEKTDCFSHQHVWDHPEFCPTHSVVRYLPREKGRVSEVGGMARDRVQSDKRRSG